MSEKKARIQYLLSEEGRKKSLIAGGDGKELQVIETEATPEIINLAEITKTGDILLKVGFDGKSKHFDAILPVITKTSLGVRNYDCDMPYWDNTRKVTYFDTPQSVEDLIQWEQQRLQNTQRDSLQPEYDRLMAEYKEKRALVEAKRKEEEEIRKAANEAREKTKEAAETERLNWIEANGSDHLRKATKLGYNCQRKYVTERAAKELPEFTLDFDNNADWKTRSCPSKEALDEVQRLVDAGHDAVVVWLTDPINPYDDEYGYEDFEPHEAIVIIRFLDSYTLIKDN